MTGRLPWGETAGWQREPGPGLPPALSNTSTEEEVEKLRWGDPGSCMVHACLTSSSVVLWPLPALCTALYTGEGRTHACPTHCVVHAQQGPCGLHQPWSGTFWVKIVLHIQTSFLVFISCVVVISTACTALYARATIHLKCVCRGCAWVPCKPLTMSHRGSGIHRGPETAPPQMPRDDLWLSQVSDKTEAWQLVPPGPMTLIGLSCGE